MKRQATDYLIIGGGFYGCCLALYLRSLNRPVLLVEAEDNFLTRASQINQARIHTGFHYPRSALTAVKSMVLHQRFMRDFSEAVVDDFQMLYAIARRGSRISARRFHRMFEDMRAPIRVASRSESALFDTSRIEQVFACSEAAFDYSVLRALLADRLDKAGVEVRLSTAVEAIEDGKQIRATLSDGTEVEARYAFNITYARLNHLLSLASLPHASLKHELAEIVLIEPPEELARYGATVMDGPFFSSMPYPAKALHSLTHVRYTPHSSWTDCARSHRATSAQLPALKQSHALHMIRDAARYMPLMRSAKVQGSLHEIKTVLLRNELDDGRPILYRRVPADSRIISILGGKIDNIYDLFDLVRQTGGEFATAHTGYLLRQPHG